MSVKVNLMITDIPWLFTQNGELQRRVTFFVSELKEEAVDPAGLARQKLAFDNLKSIIDLFDIYFSNKCEANIR